MKARAPNGFTLVEVLVALALLALVGLISWRGLDHVVEQRARADAESLAMERVLRTLAQMERDVAQRIPDALFSARLIGSTTLPFALDVVAEDGGQVRLSILRRFPVTYGVRSVTWQVDEEGWLVRRLAAAGETDDADIVVMLDGVRQLGVRFLVEGQWIEPRMLRIAGARARAVEFAIERDDGERYVQVLPL